MNTTCPVAEVAHTVKSGLSVEGSDIGSSGRFVVSPMVPASVPFGARAVDYVPGSSEFFIAEECRCAGGGHLQFSNSLSSSAASEGQINTCLLHF